LRLRYFALERDSGLRGRKLAVAAARGFDKCSNGRECLALGFAGEADAGEVHVSGAVDDAEPFTAGREAVVGASAPLPVAFEAFSRVPVRT
jgi:hypothetical protein